jgi:hypothetical protein
MKNPSKQFTDYDLLMVYLNECEDKQLQQQILSSASACKRLEQLEKDMNNIETSINPIQDDSEYGHQLWNKISNKLHEPTKQSLFEKIKLKLLAPQFSFAGLAAVFVASLTFYMLGANQNVPITEENTISNQLLAQNIQFHLAQSDIFLTQVSNMPEQSQTPMMLSTARHLLSSNRIFKSAMKNNRSTNKSTNNQHINQLLIELEQVLTEISNSSPDKKQQQIHDFTNNKLLYKVKSINQKLKNNNTLI